MKKLSNENLTFIQGGVSNRACLILGTTTLGFLLFQQWGWAVGTFAGAAGSGCFD
jgi:hypothetical protein